LLFFSLTHQDALKSYVPLSQPFLDASKELKNHPLILYFHPHLQLFFDLFFIFDFKTGFLAGLEHIEMFSEPC